MGKETGISWTDHTFNPWWGCTKVSPGCDHCYAEMQDSRYGGNHWGKGSPRRSFGDAHWRQPLSWNRAAKDAGRIGRVFCGSMCDVMDDEAPRGERERLWKLIDATPNLEWQLLTKRPQRYVRNLPKHGFEHDNVLLGTTTESQAEYNLRMPILLAAAMELEDRKNSDWRGPSIVRTFVSYEPALGPICMMEGKCIPNWLIFGGETSGDRRPMKQIWAENIREECAKFGVAFFMKQMSAFRSKEAAALIPAHLLIREFPEDHLQ